MSKDSYGLSPFELSMYLAQLADPSSTEYSVDCYFDVWGSKKEAVHSAISDMIRSHEILHSRYETKDGMPMRILTDDYPRIHWTTAPSPAAVREQAVREKEPFDLKEVPVRFTGYELPKGRILIRMEVHHIAFDGRSVMIWQKELFERLRGNSPARENDLSMRAENVYDLDPGLGFYRELFADGVPINEMPLKAPRGRTIPARTGRSPSRFPRNGLPA